jgi:hypothetical protein
MTRVVQEGPQMKNPGPNGVMAMKYGDSIEMTFHGVE